jgi:hypothetical protein
MPSEISLDHLFKIVEGQARLEEKIDRFISTQEKHDVKLGQLDARVDKVEQSVAGLKAQRRQDVAVVTVVWTMLVSVGGGVIWLVDKIDWSIVKALFAKP